MLCSNSFKLIKLLPLISPLANPSTPSIFRTDDSASVHTMDKQSHVNVGRTVMSILLYGYMYSCSLSSVLRHALFPHRTFVLERRDERA